MVSSRLSSLVLLAALLPILSCADSTSTDLTGPVSLAVVSGNGQSGPAGSELASPLVVRVENAKGQRVVGAIVNFRIVQGGGSVFAGVAITSKDGLAQERWTLGVPGPQQVEARAVDPETGAALTYAVFTANANATSFALTVSRTGAGSGTVTSAPAGINCGTTCSANFSVGATVTLTAVPSGTSAFAGWSGACTGTGSCVVTMDMARAVTASFSPVSFPLTVTRSGSGTVTSDPAGIYCGVDCTESFAGGTAVTLHASPDPGSSFTGWGGACSGTGDCTVTMNSAVAVSAVFSGGGATGTSPLVVSVDGPGTVFSSPPGIYCGVDCTEDFATGTHVTLSQVPNPGAVFGGWTGDCSGTGPCSVTMSSSKAVTARFGFPLTVALTRIGTADGVVTSSPNGIDCGTDCSEVFSGGTVVILTATPAAGSSFLGWSGACSGASTCAIEMNQASSVVAVFAQTFPLAVTLAGTGSGFVGSSPAGIQCGATCTYDFAGGINVTLDATSNAGSVFTGWSGGGCSGTGLCVVTLSAATSVTATFTLQSFNVTVSKGGPGQGTVTSGDGSINCGGVCTGAYPFGSAVTVTATPTGNSTFLGWSPGAGTCTGTSSPCTVIVTGPVSLGPVFDNPARTLTITKAGTGTGTVTSSPAGINCGATCSSLYIDGTVVTLTATPSAGSTFDGWSGGGCSGTGTCFVGMSANTTVTAIFSSGAIFVSPTGNDANPGTSPTAPMRSITLAGNRATSAAIHEVRVLGGNYNEDVIVAAGVSLFGGYSIVSGAWIRNGATTTIIGVTGGSGALRAAGISAPTTVDGFTIRGANGVGIGGSSYAVYISGSTGALVISNNNIVAGNATNGAGGGSGPPGAGGGAGQPGGMGVDDGMPPGLGGAGGASTCGANGGNGGTGGAAIGGTNGQQGQAGLPSGGSGGFGGAAGQNPFAGAPGGDAFNAGLPGTTGTPGPNGSIVGGFFVAGGQAGTGGTGGRGNGGGGGGGGGAESGTFVINGSGSGGGGGGAGGCGGQGGTGGTGGGNSYGVFQVGSSATLTSNVITTGTPGVGGAGGAGGTGGGGGAGASGGGFTSETAAGGRGGNGTAGGRGGDGGHGANGAAFQVFSTP